MNHSSMPAVGYVLPWSVRAGARVALHLSSADAQPRVSVVRLDSDASEHHDWTVRALTPSVAHGSFEQGSWLELPWDEASHAQGPWALSIEFLLTQNRSLRTLLAGCNVRLQLDKERRIVVRSMRDTAVIAELHATLDDHRWYVLELSRGRDAPLAIAIRAFDSNVPFVRAAVTVDAIDAVEARTTTSAPALGAWTIGAGSSDEPTLNARIGRIGLIVSGARVYCAIRAHNLPTFAVKSPRWDGSVDDPALAPAHYDAVHLHDDDLGHFEWDASHECNIPHDAPSGVYAFEVASAGGTERMPFFVRPLRPTSRLAFLVPTATYLAYADEFLPSATYPWRCSDRGHQFAQDNQLRSLYDVHNDGSGVSLSSQRRPKATLRDDSMYPLSNSPHLLPVDLQLLKFCSRQHIAVDVLADHDLHAEGSAALEGYTGLFTGSHPEYWSAAMLAALDAHLAGGGHLAYLGGNGFYLSVALEGDLIELRRDSQDDIWASRPGEAYMATNGESGGYWSSRGRPPQSLVGSTFLMMGFGPSRPYRRLASSHAAEWAWVFAGVDDAPIGAAGSVLGAAAGYEVDGVIEHWPQPHGLVRLAVADGFDPSFEVRKGVRAAMPVGDFAPRRADMTIYRHPGGGLVFSVGSVAWCGALPAQGQNAVGAITLNVARRFEEK